MSKPQAILVTGHPFFIDRTLIQGQIDGIPDGWIVITSDRHGLDRVVQGCVNARNNLAIHVMTPEKNEAPAAFIHRQLEHVTRVIVLTDGRDGYSLSTIIQAKRAGIAPCIIRGATLPPNLQALELEKLRERAHNAGWRDQEAIWRDAAAEAPAIFAYNMIEYAGHDILNPEREIERQDWTIDQGLGLHAKAQATIHITGTGWWQEIKWLPQDRYIDPFVDEDELVNLEDFTTEECGIIDDAMCIGYGGKVGWRIKNHVPLSQELFQEMKQAVEAWQ